MIGKDMAQEKIEIAVVGSAQSGKSLLTECLQRASDAEDKGWIFSEIHDLDDLHAHRFAVILQVVDCMNLEQSLLLTPHIIDEQEKIVMAFNRYDMLLQTDHSLNLREMRTLIGVPLELVSAATGQGIAETVRLIGETLQRPLSTAHPIYHLRDLSDEDAYEAYVHGILTRCLRHAENDRFQTTLEKVDKVLTNKWIGFPLMLLTLFVVFQCTFTLGAYPQEWIQMGIDALCDWGHSVLPAVWWSSLLIDGVVQGVGAVLAFLPNIIIIFFFISLMEDSGYMARMAYLMDSIMHRVGLHGRSFVPMLVGFGCNVPAIMAARDIKDPKDRTLTMLMVPFMSCSARLPVYMLFVDTFFARYKALVMLSLYVTGIGLSILFALIMKRTKWFRKPADDSVNELPAFRVPSLRATGAHIWERVADYLQKISTVIIWASVIIWALEYFPTQNLDNLENSYLAMIGKAIAPVLAPCGFDWKMSVCLLTGLPAKEAIVSTMAILYGGDIATAAFTPVTAYGFMLFTLLYFPCIATIATLRREAGAKWAWFTVLNSLVLAWTVAALVNALSLLIG